MGFVHDTIFANADLWNCVVQMYGLYYQSYNNLHIFHFLAFEPFCFPCIRLHFIPLVLDKLHVRYDHTDDDVDTE